MTLRPSNIDEVLFEPKDTEVFRIPDVKTRLATLQNYFFPRLEFLARFALERVERVYGVNPYDRMTFIYRPSHRKDAKVNVDFGEAHVGISGKRQSDRPLAVKHRNGKPYVFHSSYLTFNVFPEGYMCVQLAPFTSYVDQDYLSSASMLFRKSADLLIPMFAIQHISYLGAHDFVPIHEYMSFTTDTSSDVAFFSPFHTFPVDASHGLSNLVGAFVVLYPLIDSLISLAEGKEPRLPEMLQKYREWWFSPRKPSTPDADEPAPGVPEIPELDSYSFIRAGLWWDVLARDKWTCRSCGRSAKDGVTLHVDHIVPRSLGGADDPDNLQTLCRKCNIGKSNRDRTDLR